MEIPLSRCERSRGASRYIYRGKEEDLSGVGNLPFTCAGLLAMAGWKILLILGDDLAGDDPLRWAAR